MSTIEAASAEPERKVIDVQKTLGLPDSTPNPHLWYNPDTMPGGGEGDLPRPVRSRPRPRPLFSANLANFDRSLKPWLQAIARFKAAHPHIPWPRPSRSPTTCWRPPEPTNATPWALQADIMNGVDPAPEDITLQDSLFTGHKVKVFLYNEQVADSITQSFLELARRTGYRSSVFTKRCPHPVTTTRPGCWPRSAHSRGRSPTVSTEQL